MKELLPVSFVVDSGPEDDGGPDSYSGGISTEKRLRLLWAAVGAAMAAVVPCALALDRYHSMSIAAFGARNSANYVSYYDCDSGQKVKAKAVCDEAAVVCEEGGLFESDKCKSLVASCNHFVDKVMRECE